MTRGANAQKREVSDNSSSVEPISRSGRSDASGAPWWSVRAGFVCPGETTCEQVCRVQSSAGGPGSNSCLWINATLHTPTRAVKEKREGTSPKRPGGERTQPRPPSIEACVTVSRVSQAVCGGGNSHTSPRVFLARVRADAPHTIALRVRPAPPGPCAATSPGPGCASHQLLRSGRLTWLTRGFSRCRWLPRPRRPTRRRSPRPPPRP